jgi:beta-N-acetylhexosaminidase
MTIVFEMVRNSIVQQFMHSFDGTMPPPEILAGVREGQISAFCHFAHRNVVSPAQIRELNLALYQAAREGNQPLPIIGIDQEGGQLIAITKGTTELPGNMALGATRSLALAEKAGRVLGKELLAMGFNMNFAPSLDVNVNPYNPVIGTRSFGDNAELVASLGVALIRGMQAERVIANAKHFPGHGDTAQDTHYHLPVVQHSIERMKSVELVPFKAAIEANVASIMTAHLLFPALDTENPATISGKVLTEFLRQELGFTGLIVTDAMDMHAVAQFGPEPSITAAINAGADIIMLAHLTDQIALSERMRSVANPEAVRRIHHARLALPQTIPDLSVVGSAEHQQIAQEIADASITLVKQTNPHSLPLHPREDETILVITPEPTDLTPADTSSGVTIMLDEAIRKRHTRVQSVIIRREASIEEVVEVLRLADSADKVIIGTIIVERDASQAELVRALHQRGKDLIVIALRTPYDIMAFPMIPTYLCAYGIRPVTMEALARVLFGEIQPRGTLPCLIPDVDLTAS